MSGLLGFKELDALSRGVLLLVGLVSQLTAFIAHLVPPPQLDWLGDQENLARAPAHLAALVGFLFILSKRHALHRFPPPSFFLAMSILLALALLSAPRSFSQELAHPAALLLSLGGLLIHLLAVFMISLGLTSWSAQSLVFTRIYGQVRLGGTKRPGRLPVFLKIGNDRVDTLSNRRGGFQFLISRAESLQPCEVQVEPPGLEPKFRLVPRTRDGRRTIRKDFSWHQEE